MIKRTYLAPITARVITHFTYDEEVSYRIGDELLAIAEVDYSDFKTSKGYIVYDASINKAFSLDSSLIELAIPEEQKLFWVEVSAEKEKAGLYVVVSSDERQAGIDTLSELREENPDPSVHNYMISSDEITFSDSDLILRITNRRGGETNATD